MGGLFDPEVNTKERRIWVKETELVATCSDGSSMRYKEGPLGAPNPPGMKNGPAPPVGYWDDWFRKAWGRTPIGLEIDPPPRIGPGQVDAQLLAQVRAVNARYPEPGDGKLRYDKPGLRVNSFVVQAGQRIELKFLSEGLCSGKSSSCGRKNTENVEITGYREDPEHTHGRVSRDAQGNFFFTADANYSGPAYFYMGLFEKYTRMGEPKESTNEVGVPLQIISPQEAAERRTRELMKAQQAASAASAAG
ncbi:MAG: hypothetical protein Q4G39_03995 [Brachymonas sp.]|nr:hypothetical protein [Brachymonas sp.]